MCRCGVFSEAFNNITQGFKKQISLHFWHWEVPASVGAVELFILLCTLVALVSVQQFIRRTQGNTCHCLIDVLQCDLEWFNSLCSCHYKISDYMFISSSWIGLLLTSTLYFCPTAYLLLMNVGTHCVGQNSCFLLKQVAWADWNVQLCI